MSEPRNEPFAYVDRLVAFVDVLGFSHLTLHSEDDVETMAKVGKLAATNTLFEAFFGKLMTHAKAAFFSNSFMVSTGPEEIIYLVREIGYLCRYLLLLGLPCRGGISCGSLHHEGRVIVGPALIRAYQLEHCIAEMPRVILDEAAMQCWRHEFRPGLAHPDLETLVKTDEKGIHQFDLFDPGWGDSFLPWTDFIPAPDTIPQDHQEFLAMARVQIKRGLKVAHDDRVRAKYEWLASNCGGVDEPEGKVWLRDKLAGLSKHIGMGTMSEQPHDLHTFMAQVTDEMASEYKRIYARAAKDPGTAGDEGEENWATLLREWLPPTYHVETKGRLIGTDGTMSPQIDVLVLKPSYPLKLREKKVWLAGGVAAVFECKTTLRSEHIAASAERCKQFKALYKPRTGSPRRELKSPLVYGLLAHSHVWKSPGSHPVENVDSAVFRAMMDATKPGEGIDLLCVADLGVWSAMDVAMYQAKWAPDDEKLLTEVFGGPWGVQTATVCSAMNQDNQKDEFRPIGALVALLTQALAWEDASVRDLADYYRLANLWGQGKGPSRPWPATVYSEAVRNKVAAGALTNGIPWDEWSVGQI